MTGVTFTDTFPAGIAISTPNGLLSACTPGSTLGAITAVAGSGVVSLAASTLQPGGACTVQVNVVGTAPGPAVNSVTAVDPVGGQSNAAVATINVLAIAPPTIAKAFGAPTIPLGGSTTLTLTLTAAQALAGVSFIDTLPAGLVVSTPISGLTTTCGSGTITAVAGSSTISLTGLTFAAAGSCTITVNVTGQTAGVKVNSVQVSDINAGIGNVAQATLAVLVPPTLTKVFAQNSIGIGDVTTLTFTIANPNAATLVSGITFSDTLPANLLISSPSGLNLGTCAGAITVTANAGTNLINVTGLSLAGGSSCQFSLNVTGIAVGALTNTTSAITSVATGTGLTASAAIAVAAVDAFQVRYVSNLNVSDAYINLTNVGLVNGFDPAGRICVNVYAFDPAEELIGCCACEVTPNGLNSLSARNDLISNTLTPGVPTSITIKLVANYPVDTAGARVGCNAAGVTGANLAPGMRAWASTVHALPTTPVTYGMTETPFSRAQLSTSELSKMSSYCGFIQATGSGYGICKSCRLGGLQSDTR